MTEQLAGHLAASQGNPTTEFFHLRKAEISPRQLKLWCLCFEADVPICPRSAIISFQCIAQ